MTINEFQIHNLVGRNFFTSFYVKIMTFLSQFFHVGDHSFSQLLPFLWKITPTIYIPFDREEDFKEYLKIKNLILNFFPIFWFSKTLEWIINGF